MYQDVKHQKGKSSAKWNSFVSVLLTLSEGKVLGLNTTQFAIVSVFVFLLLTSYSGFLSNDTKNDSNKMIWISKDSLLRQRKSVNND